MWGARQLVLTWRWRRASRAGLLAAMPTPDQAPHCRLVHSTPCIAGNPQLAFCFRELWYCDTDVQQAREKGKDTGEWDGLQSGMLMNRLHADLCLTGSYPRIRCSICRSIVGLPRRAQHSSNGREGNAASQRRSKQAARQVLQARYLWSKYLPQACMQHAATVSSPA